MTDPLARFRALFRLGAAMDAARRELAPAAPGEIIMHEIAKDTYAPRARANVSHTLGQVFARLRAALDEEPDDQ